MDPDDWVSLKINGILDTLTPSATHLYRAVGRIPGRDFSAACAAAAAGVERADVDRDLRVLVERFVLNTDRLTPATEQQSDGDHHDGRPTRPTSERPASAHGAGQNLCVASGARYWFPFMTRMHAIFAGHPDIRPEYAAAEGRVRAWDLHHFRAAARTVMPTHPLLPNPLLGTTPPAPAPGLDDHDTALAWMDGERFNLVEVVRQARDRHEDAVAIALADTAQPWAILRADPRFGRDVDLIAVTAAQHAEDTAAVFSLRNRIARATAMLGQIAHARHLATELADQAQTTGNPHAQACALTTRGMVAHHAGEHVAALADMLRAITILQELGGPRPLALALIAAADELVCLTEPARITEALNYLQRACVLLAGLRPEADRYNHGRGLICMARAHLLNTNPVAAEALLHVALASMRACRADHQEAVTHDLLALAARAQRHAHSASEHEAKARALRRPSADPHSAIP